MQLKLIDLFRSIRWAKNGDLTDFSQTNYEAGWAHLGDDTPTVQDFNYVQAMNDQKDQWLFAQINEVLKAQGIEATEDDLPALKRAIENLVTAKSTPKTITSATKNTFDNNGHSHEIAQATTTQAGIVQLLTAITSTSETHAATPKAVKTVKDQLDSVSRNLANYIPNSKKSSSVSSTSGDTVATSAAVKTAYDKGVEALNKANQVDAATLKKNGNQSINGVLKAENVGNAWAAYKFGAKQGEWQLEVHPDSHTAGNRRFNMLWSPTGGNRVHLGFPHIGDNGETVAYQSWVGQNYVKKSGDTMTGNLTINNGEPSLHGKRGGNNSWYVGLPNGTSDSLYLHSYASNTSLSLESDKINTTKPVFSAGNRTAVSLNGHNIQFRWNNNGNLDLKVDNTELGNIHYTHQRYVSVTANNGDYAGLHIQRKGSSGNFWARAEALPDRRWKFVTEGGASVFMQNKSGTVALLEDVRHVSRVNKSTTIRGTSTEDSGNTRNISLTGMVMTHPDGRIVQILHLRNFRMIWFALEQPGVGGYGGDRGHHISLPLWTAMPNKIVSVNTQLMRATGAASITYNSEAGEWVSAWQLWGKENERSWVNINTNRVEGGSSEPIDLYVVVEGY